MLSIQLTVARTDIFNVKYRIILTEFEISFKGVHAYIYVFIKVFQIYKARRLASSCSKTPIIFSEYKLDF